MVLSHRSIFFSFGRFFLRARFLFRTWFFLWTLASLLSSSRSKCYAFVVQDVGHLWQRTFETGFLKNSDKSYCTPSDMDWYRLSQGPQSQFIFTESFLPLEQVLATIFVRGPHCIFFCVWQAGFQSIILI